MQKPLFITGIGTDVGKTIVSAILTEKLKADYWKPIQAGDLEKTDQYTVSELVSNTETNYHPETYRFKMAASPHTAAEAENIEIKLEDFELPNTNRQLLIEGAGGLLVPLSKRLLMIDLIELFQAEVILVIRNYLGCINHSLLSLEALTNRNIPIRLVVFNGEMDESTKEILINHLPKNTPYSQVPEFKTINKINISNCPILIGQ